MFNKREITSGNKIPSGSDEPESETKGNTFEKPIPEQRASSNLGGYRESAVIGPSIRINGDLHGDEDLTIEGEVKGTIHLKNNALTIGSQGKVKADVYAHNVYVDGFMEGDLYGAERISIRKSAEVSGNITAPRVSLDDGAKFKGSIEMDPKSEALKTAFGDNQSAGKNNSQTSSASKNTGFSKKPETTVNTSSEGASGKAG